MLQSKIDPAPENPHVVNRTLLSELGSKVQVKMHTLNDCGTKLIDIEELLETVSFDHEDFDPRSFRLFEYQSELTVTLYKQAAELASMVRDIRAQLDRQPNLTIEADKCEMAVLQFALHCAEEDAQTWLEKLYETEAQVERDN